MKAAKKAIGLLGGEVKDQIEFELPESNIGRTLVVIEKKNATPKKFPRKAGMPAKEPIQ